MKKIFEKIFHQAEPFLITRKNDIHTRIALSLACTLMEKEGGDEDIVIPAIILHDVGWKSIPENIQLDAFGPCAASPALNRVHEVEGKKIAADLLNLVGYDKDKVQEILTIIEGHDSGHEAISRNDEIVKDADKLWRYTKEGFYIDMKRFKETPDMRLKRLHLNLKSWFFTRTARERAGKEWFARSKEYSMPGSSKVLRD